MLTDESSTEEFGGVDVRNGTIAAFVAKSKALDSLADSDPGYAVVTAQIRNRVPAVRAVGVFDVLQSR